MPCRIGIGYDIHRLVAGRPLVIGGVKIPHDRGLLGHSDADVVVHAVCDAILGALAAGDIGEHFPDTSPETEGMDSLEMLRRVAAMLGGRLRIANIDINCICERPRLSGHRREMVTAISTAAGVDPSAVSIKFRTSEGLGPVGLGEAVSAQAVVLLEEVA
ncbi:MAG TPA: 2-C-methyl-D-erythritol 2,4-cyclodiphosphate synthase [Deltaproteobacteria bacterium]|nr:2-C-methyl-D-erythritol 2,4-cyclodiphosphate synthase [Deltaproteobacteria bacterium]HOM28448.1 2-C-methyl-D-erythritol 2,4-cyclodiphosphate synthase [Deltaproteobacteria bacterium]HPP79675.1 2-C-methyl-D-erythritol 2,4-cyclodiphosphate synthase [Deltaproteobacteria bacterium]